MYNPAKPYKDEILRLIEGTWDTPYVRVRSGVYPVIRKKFSGLEVHHTDGIGTKGVYHARAGSFKNAVLDALAMNLNDLAMAGATPYALLDHITVADAGGEAVLKIVRALSAECKKRKIAIVGGETSHHDNVDGLDIGISMAGFIKEPRKNRFEAGDTLIGLKSSGLHSNGFTKVRGMFGPDEWRDDFIRPTAIYAEKILPLLKKHEVHGMMHITGGAFTKLKDLLPGLDAHIAAPPKLSPQPIFHELHERGIPDADMYRTFNCGIGFVLGVPEHGARAAVRALGAAAAVIGRVEKGEGKVVIRSAFSKRGVVL